MCVRRARIISVSRSVCRTPVRHRRRARGQFSTPFNTRHRVCVRVCANERTPQSARQSDAETTAISNMVRRGTLARKRGGYSTVRNTLCTYKASCVNERIYNISTTCVYMRSQHNIYTNLVYKSINSRPLCTGCAAQRGGHQMFAQDTTNQRASAHATM